MRKLWILAIGVATVLTATAGFAVVPPEDGGLREKELRHPDLYIGNTYRPVGALPVEVSRGLAPDLSRLGVDPANAYFDLRTGRWGTLIVTQPLIPGPGFGNDLTWSALGYQAAPEGEALKQAAWSAFRSYLIEHAAELRVDPQELAEPRVTVLGDRLLQIHADRQYQGIPVRETFVKAAINSGNLVLTGTRNWAQITVETRPTITSQQAEAALSDHVELPATGSREEPRLEIVPVSSRADASLAAPGTGIDHRLVWVLSPDYADDLGTWEALVDAHSGELLAFTDLNHYVSHEQAAGGSASRRVEGGVYPVSNDGVPPDGVEVPDFPMPFADIAVDGTPIGFTTTGGNVPAGGETGTISTILSGQFVRMNDNCGAINESSDDGDLDLEEGPGTNCEVPPGHSAGNTHSSRSGFYELNRLKEQARGYLTDNTWLQQQLTANMNINLHCNAFWGAGGTVNFYREGTHPSGTFCHNTGEIAAIFDHEWGHGMDNNDGLPNISRPGEGIADIFAINRLNESCIGRNFTLSNCGGYGDACLECTGVREVDWDKHASHAPHGADYAVACPFTTGNIGPCGRGTHCEGHLVSEMAWDLVHRDFPTSYGLDLNTALELGTRLAYFGSSNVFNWYQCDDPDPDSIDGCNSDSGYLGYLAADDDNGNLTDGTPHMSAIFDAFDRHDIACPTPTVQDSGCAGAPTEAPDNLAATTFSEGMELTWDAVPDAEEYWIFRTEGVHGCDFGKALVGTTTDTEFTETGLRNGFELFYSVVAVGANDACTSPMSECLSVFPVSGPSGFIEGTVTDADSSAPIEGAEVEAAGPVTVSDTTDDAGFYRILAPVGTYDVTATAAQYDPETVEDVAVVDGATEMLDFELTLTPAPIADISPDSFDFEVPLDGSDSDTLNIGNIGVLDLDWSLAETDGALVSLGGPADWSDDFDDYETGSEIHGQGGWKGWDNSPAAGALVSDAQENSTPNSVEIVGASDLVREFSGYDSGYWIFTAWQFIPSDFSGETYFILLNDYEDGAGQGNNWSTQVNFNGSQVVNDGNSGGTLPLIKDQWVELRVEIDLDNDTQDFYYDGELLFSGTWTNELSGGGMLNIGAVDLFANGASAVYYDDTSLVAGTPPGDCAAPTDVPWLSATPDSGTTPPAGSDPVNVMVDATGLEPGEHTARLCLTTNDPAAQLVEIPVSLTVVDTSGPFIDVDPESLESTLPQDGTETQTLTVSNPGGETLDWEVTEGGGLALRAPRSTRTASAPEPAVATGQAATVTRGDSGAAAMDLASELGSPLPSLAVVNAGLGDIDCDGEPGIVIHDDGTLENGYSGNPAAGVTEVRFVDKFTPAAYPATYSAVCLGFITGSGPTTYDVEVVVFDDDGAGGEPGTELGSVSATVTVTEIAVPIPPGQTAAWNSVDISSLGLDVTEGSVYIGARWAPIGAGLSNVFIAGDQSTDRPEGFAGGFWWNNNSGTWVPIQTDPGGFPGYRSLMVRAVEGQAIDCTLPAWLSVDPDSGSVPASGSQVVDVAFDAAGLDPGVYEATICLTSNAANSPLLAVPVTLTVVEGMALFEAASLEVDTAADASDGNGVFEPGEQVDVVPGWRNDGTIAGLLSGTASGFTGPAGADYTLVDDGADYDEVDPGETATCQDGADCYAMSVDAPAVRPATHWVAMFDESLSDGTDKTWMLHIGDSFTDVPRSNIFYRSVETLLHSGVTGGCDDGEYCPGDANSRSQMPAFMLRALEGPDYMPQACLEGEERLFDDVPASNLFCRWIEDLANRGIVAGCGDGNYCPSDSVTRAQMSIFLLKTLEGSDYTPDECSGQFDDVPCPSLFANWIEDLAARGITGGCTATEYCPTDAVTRGQMGAFITKTFGFTLYGP